MHLPYAPRTTRESLMTSPISSTAPARLQIDGMSCDHCVAAVRTALAKVPGITLHTVTIGSATVTASPAALAHALAALDDAGFTASVRP